MPCISHIRKIAIQGEKSIQEDQSIFSIELELPGEVQKLLREVVNKKKESDQSTRKAASGRGNNTHAQGKNCAEPQSAIAGTNKKVKGNLINNSLLSTSTH